MLERLGIDLEEFPDGLVIHGRGGFGSHTFHSGRVRSHNDHRLAMSAAVASVQASGSVCVEAAQAVNKSYPGFFADFARLGGQVSVEGRED